MVRGVACGVRVRACRCVWQNVKACLRARACASAGARARAARSVLRHKGRAKRARARAARRAAGERFLKTVLPFAASVPASARCSVKASRG